jgi:hypothetical protein
VRAPSCFDRKNLHCDYYMILLRCNYKGGRGCHNNPYSSVNLKNYSYFLSENIDIQKNTID